MLNLSDNSLTDNEFQDPSSGGDGQVVEVSQQSAWSGPLPPPAILDQFNNVVENGAERIVSAWESETKHRQSLERKELSLYALDSVLGKIFAFIFVVGALFCSLWAAISGAEVFATVLGGGTIASVVWAFVSSSKTNSPVD